MALKAKQAWEGVNVTLLVQGMSNTVPKSMTNYKFTHAAVACVAAWVQDAVLLTKMNEDLLSSEPFSFLLEPPVKESWENVKTRVMNGIESGGLDVEDDEVVKERQTLLDNMRDRFSAGDAHVTIQTNNAVNTLSAHNEKLNADLKRHIDEKVETFQREEKKKKLQRMIPEIQEAVLKAGVSHIPAVQEAVQQIDLVVHENVNDSSLVNASAVHANSHDEDNLPQLKRLSDLLKANKQQWVCAFVHNWNEFHSKFSTVDEAKKVAVKSIKKDYYKQKQLFDALTYVKIAGSEDSVLVKAELLQRNVIESDCAVTDVIELSSKKTKDNLLDLESLKLMKACRIEKQNKADSERKEARKKKKVEKMQSFSEENQTMNMELEELARK